MYNRSPKVSVIFIFVLLIWSSALRSFETLHIHSCINSLVNNPSPPIFQITARSKVRFFKHFKCEAKTKISWIIFLEILIFFIRCGKAWQVWALKSWPRRNSKNWNIPTRFGGTGHIPPGQDGHKRSHKGTNYSRLGNEGIPPSLD